MQKFDFPIFRFYARFIISVRFPSCLFLSFLQSWFFLFFWISCSFAFMRSYDHDSVSLPHLCVSHTFLWACNTYSNIQSEAKRKIYNYASLLCRAFLSLEIKLNALPCIERLFNFWKCSSKLLYTQCRALPQMIAFTHFYHFLELTTFYLSTSKFVLRWLPSFIW